MIKGKVLQRVFIEKPQVNYRKLDALNQSMIALFDENPILFFRQFKLGEPRKDKPTVPTIIGDLVHFHLLECNGDDEAFENRFDEKFALFNGTIGSGQAYVLADALFEVTQENMTPSGEVTATFDSRFKDAFYKIKMIKEGNKDKYYKGKTVEQALEDFVKIDKKGSSGEMYFQARLENIGKIVVDVSLVDKSRMVGNALRNDDFTRQEFMEKEGVEVFNHFPIEWNYNLDERRFIPCKSEIDKLKIDHNNKTIHPIDLKTTFDNENFNYAYIKGYYYIQNAFYDRAVIYWKTQEGLDDYSVVPMKFIVGDTSANNRRPLVYDTTDIDRGMGWHGFTMRGNKYRGVKELVEEIAWCEENGIWNCSKETYDKRGQLELKIQYDN